MMPRGHKLSAETRAKMSAAKIGRKKSDETRARMSAAQKAKGWQMTPERQAKMEEGKRLAAEAGLLKCLDGCTCGRHGWSAERKAQHSKKCMGNNAGKKHGPPSDEHREKNRQGQLRRYSDPKERAKASTHTKKLWLAGVYDKNHKTHGFSGYHRGVWMRCINSEGVFAQELDKAGIEWQYEPRRFKLSIGSYTPDFYLPELDVWVDVNGWLKPDQARKIEAFRRETGKTLSLIFQSELPSLKYRGD